MNKPFIIHGPITAFFFDLDGVLVSHPENGHSRSDYQRLHYLEDIAIGHAQLRHFIGKDTLRKNLPVYYSTSDPSNFESTDLSYVLFILNGLRPYTNPTKDDIKLSRELIRAADHQHKKILNKSVRSEYFEHDKQLVRTIKDLKSAYPRAGFFVNSGNTKYMSQQKVRDLGLMEVFSIDGYLPNYPIYGEDILHRWEGIDWLRQNDQICKNRGNQVLFCDRPADSHAFGYAKEGGTTDYLVYFNKPPDKRNLEDGYNAPGSANYLIKLSEEGRLLCLSPEEPMRDNIKSLREAFNLEISVHPERGRFL